MVFFYSGLPPAVQRAASHIVRKAAELDIQLGGPVAVAVAAIYMACKASDGMKKTQDEICDVAGVPVVTLRGSWKRMEPRTDELLPEDFSASID